MPATDTTAVWLRKAKRPALSVPSGRRRRDRSDRHPFHAKEGGGVLRRVRVGQSGASRKATLPGPCLDGSVAAIMLRDGFLATPHRFPMGDPRWTSRELTGAVRDLSFTADGSSVVAATGAAWSRNRRCARGLFPKALAKLAQIASNKQSTAGSCIELGSRGAKQSAANTP